MVFIRSFRFNIQIHAGGITQALKEMKEHFRRHISHHLTVELSVPDQPRTSAEIEGNATQAIIHRQTIAVPFNAALIAQGFQQCLSKSDRRILYRFMLVNVQITLHKFNLIHSGMFSYLVQHMVKKT